MTRIPSTDSAQPRGGIDASGNGHVDGMTTSTAATHSPGWKRALLWLAGGVLALALLIVVAGAVMQSFIGHERQLLRLLQIAQQWHAVGLIVQCAIVTLVIARWKALVAWGITKGIVQPFEIERALAFRGKAATFLLLYLLLIPIGPHRLWLLLAG